MKVKKGDRVKIRSGKDAGKTGAIIRVFPKENRVTVEGVNLYKKRVRPKGQRQKGEVVLVARPLPVSRVSLVCNSCKRQTRVGFRREGNKRVRYCKRCDAAL